MNLTSFHYLEEFRKDQKEKVQERMQFTIASKRIKYREIKLLRRQETCTLKTLRCDERNQRRRKQMERLFNLPKVIEQVSGRAGFGVH